MCQVACQAPPVANGPTEIQVFIPDRESFEDQALTFLRERDFPPEYVSREEGLILSQPSTSQQWFEWWRHDSMGGYQLLESSIHTIRRRVTVKIEPLGEAEAVIGAPAEAEADVAEDTQPTDEPAMAIGGENYRLSVEVIKERYSAPERQVTTTSGAMAIYSERMPTTGGIRVSREASEQWVSLGRDVLLEEYLLNKLALLTPPLPNEPQSE